MTTAASLTPAAVTSDKTVVLFDGVCNFCNSTINFLIDRDPADRFRFAAQQSESGQQLMARHGVTGLMLNTMVVIDEGKIYTHSAAAVRIARHLPWPWKALSTMWIVPWFVRDWGYKFFAAHRYRWFGQTESCRMPTPEIRAKFL